MCGTTKSVSAIFYKQEKTQKNTTEIICNFMRQYAWDQSDGVLCNVEIRILTSGLKVQARKIMPLFLRFIESERCHKALPICQKED